MKIHISSLYINEYIKRILVNPKTKKVQNDFLDHLCYLCLVFFMLLCLFIATLWSPAGTGLAFSSCL